MAVYTALDAETLAALVAQYDIGTLLSAKGIAEGISNSNWLLETTGGGDGGGRYVLTLYERRIDPAELPFFLGLLDHLAACGCPVPRTVHGRDGTALRKVAGKAAALIAFLPGVSPGQPTPAQARAVGAALAGVHRAAADYAGRRRDRLAPPDNLATLEAIGAQRLAALDPLLGDVLHHARALVATWPEDLPRSVIHSDLFPDNVLMLGEEVTGLIDFYFACEGAMAYDLAVTHAAWCFDGSGRSFSAERAAALLAGYESVRPLSPMERAALPLLAQGACLRFVASRAEDWAEALDTGKESAPNKNPADFARRWRLYCEAGETLFA